MPAKKDPWASTSVIDAITRHAEKFDQIQALDGFRNELTGIGSWLRDKTFGGLQGGPVFDLHLLTSAECEARWRGSDLGARIVETIPDEMTREGFDLTIQPEDENADEVDDFSGVVETLDGQFEALGVDQAFRTALQYERAYGGAAILVGIDDGLPLSRPVDVGRINRVTHLTPLTGGWDGECVAWSWYSDMSRPEYGRPETYMIRNIGTPLSGMPIPGEKNPQPVGFGDTIQWVHASRLLIFPGSSTSTRARVQMRGWGDSVFTRVDRVLSNYDQTWGAVANIMTDFSQSYLKIKGLAQMLSSKQDETNRGSQSITARARLLQMTRSIANMVLVDQEEDFGRDTASIAGVGELLDKFALRLAAAADMPVALLMGQAPTGLNATGASDIRFFYDRVAARRARELLPNRKKLLRLFFLAKEGPTEGREPQRWACVPRSLYQLSDLEKADLRLKQSQVDVAYINAQVLTPEEVAVSRFGRSEYSTDTVIDLEAREKMAEARAEEKAEAPEKVDAWDPDQPRDEKGRWSGEGGGGGGGETKSPLERSRAEFEKSRTEYWKGQTERRNAIAAKHGVDPLNIHQHAGAWKEYKRGERPLEKEQRAKERAIQERAYKEKQAALEAHQTAQAKPPTAQQMANTPSIPTGRNWVDHVDGTPHAKDGGTLAEHFPGTQVDAHGNPTKIGTPTPQRAALHADIRGKFLDHVKPAADGEKQAIVTMGGPASGKSSAMKKMGVDKSRFVQINSDDVKDHLPEYRHMTDADGSRGRSARDAAAVVHHESSHVAEQILEHSIRDGKSLIYDGTGENAEKHIAMIQRLKSEGYHVTLMMTDLSLEKGVERAGLRAEREGRIVPAAVVHEAYSKIPGNFERIAGHADDFALIDNHGAEARPVWTKTGGKETQHDVAYIEKFRANKPRG